MSHPLALVTVSVREPERYRPSPCRRWPLRVAMLARSGERLASLEREIANTQASCLRRNR